MPTETETSMILIEHPVPCPRAADWAQLLKELVVAHRLAENPNLQEPMLTEGSKPAAIGESAITDYLNQLKRDVTDWRAPGCGV